eukprot:2485813-Karenia_brevis.AAC.1
MGCIGFSVMVKTESGGPVEFCVQNVWLIDSTSGEMICTQAMGRYDNWFHRIVYSPDDRQLAIASATSLLIVMKMFFYFGSDNFGQTE